MREALEEVKEEVTGRIRIQRSIWSPRHPQSLRQPLPYCTVRGSSMSVTEVTHVDTGQDCHLHM